MLLFKKKKNIKKNKNFYSYFFYYFGIFSFFITILVTLHSIPFFKFAINKLVFKDNIDTLKFFETVSREISYKIIGPSYFSVNTPKKSLDFLKIFFF
jgi:hypothetical protein